MRKSQDIPQNRYFEIIVDNIHSHTFINKSDIFSKTNFTNTFFVL